MSSLVRGFSISHRARNVSSHGSLFSSSNRTFHSRNVSISATRKERVVDNEKEMKDRECRRFAEEQNKKFGKGTVMRLSDKPIEAPKVSTGLLSLDFAFGGGLPIGRIIEIYGPESSGKTSLALHLLATLQKSGGNVAFIDLENAMNVQYSMKIGVTEDLYMFHPSSGEDVFDMVNQAVRTRAWRGICIDSVSAIVPLAELEASIGDSQMAATARLMSKGLRNVVQSGVGSEEDGCTVIFINQIRNKIGISAMYGSPETRSGGRALGYHCSLILDLRSTEKILDDDKKQIGQRIKVTVKKNKLAASGRYVDLILMYETGFCKLSSTLDAAVEMKVVNLSGSWYSFGDTKIGQGREKTISFLKENPKILQEIENSARAEYLLRIEKAEAEKAEAEASEMIVKDGVDKKSSG
eukprot:g2579.t1